ncbi:HRDC domain-containing protein [bacterium]|nr:HRDC domain-containing protein [bacterium]
MSKYDNLDEYQNSQIEELRQRVAKLEEQVSSLMMQSLSPKQQAPSSESSEPKAKQEELTEEEQKLYDTLKDWRFARAKAMEKPAYVICNNQLLIAICKIRPRTAEELDELPGAGDKFMEAYAKEVLEIVNPAQKQETRSWDYMSSKRNDENEDQRG